MRIIPGSAGSRFICSFRRFCKFCKISQISWICLRLHFDTCTLYSSNFGFSNTQIATHVKKERNSPPPFGPKLQYKCQSVSIDKSRIFGNLAEFTKSTKTANKAAACGTWNNPHNFSWFCWGVIGSIYDVYSTSTCVIHFSWIVKNCVKNCILSFEESWARASLEQVHFGRRRSSLDREIYY